jgi:hypothetical protein
MPKFVFTSYDKAIVAAILAPLLSLGTSWVQGGDLDQKTVIAAVVSAVLAGLAVYFKSNGPASSPVASPTIAPPAS